MGPEHLIAAVAAWSARQQAILAACVCGSHARGTARADSDVDLVLVCTARERLLSDTSWTEDFGRVRSVAFESYGLVESVRVAYDKGPEVEFGLTTVAWITLPVDAGTAGVMRGGLRILYDPSGRLAQAVRSISGSSYGSASRSASM